MCIGNDIEGSVELLRLLYEHGAGINAETSTGSQSASCIAVKFDQGDALRFLGKFQPCCILTLSVSVNADLNAGTEDVPLVAAAAKGMFLTVLLVQLSYRCRCIQNG